jgi:inner membrane protein
LCRQYVSVGAALSKSRPQTVRPYAQNEAPLPEDSAFTGFWGRQRPGNPLLRLEKRPRPGLRSPPSLLLDISGLCLYCLGMAFEWYHWAILGISLVASELLVPAFVLVWFGLGGLAVALLLALFPATGFIAQLLVWMVCSVALVLLWFKVFKPHQHKITSGRSSAEAVGEVGLLVNDIAPFGKAKVRFQTPLLGADVWECVSDEKIAAGNRVKVVSVEGSLLKITKNS